MIAKFRKRKKDNFWKEVFLPVVLGLVALGLIGFLIFYNLKIYQRRSELTSRIEELQRKIKDLEKEKEFLESGISQAEREEYIEKIAKERLNLQKEGERAVSFVLPEGKEKKEQEGQNSFWVTKKGIMFLSSIIILFLIIVGMIVYNILKIKRKR